MVREPMAPVAPKTVTFKRVYILWSGRAMKKVTGVTLVVGVGLLIRLLGGVPEVEVAGDVLL